MANKPMKTINFGGEDTYYLNPDFENIDNSPFETIGGDTLTWDGNTEGREIVELGDGNAMVHISDTVLTIDELSNGGSIIVAGGSESEIFPAEATELMPGLIMINEFFCIVIAENIVGVDIDGISFPRKGIYFLSTGEYGTTALKINGYTGFTTTKLKEEYLPQTTQAGVFYFKFTAPGAEADPYIYHDAECTSKVTKAELLDAGKKGAVRVFNAVGGFSTALSVVVYSDYASVLLVHSNTNAEPGAVQVTYKNLFTAEYTG